ncbi:MAG: hypothetical protein WAW39_16125 [Prosthecobacter sp.]|uniref:hypothetical protein n=1 Tax=Prosthecobacter sp. TaxID=1965333 RepID=UPI003BB0E3EA
MNPFSQPEITASRAAEVWPPETVLAINVFLLQHPSLDMQPWFEEQVVLHLGCSPHGRRVDSSSIA